VEHSLLSPTETAPQWLVPTLWLLGNNVYSDSKLQPACKARDLAFGLWSGNSGGGGGYCVHSSPSPGECGREYSEIRMVLENFPLSVGIKVNMYS